MKYTNMASTTVFHSSDEERVFDVITLFGETLSPHSRTPDDSKSTLLKVKEEAAKKLDPHYILLGVNEIERNWDVTNKRFFLIDYMDRVDR